jgi:hypothetical protein
MILSRDARELRCVRERVRGRRRASTGGEESEDAWDKGKEVKIQRIARASLIYTCGRTGSGSDAGESGI